MLLHGPVGHLQEAHQREEVREQQLRHDAEAHPRHHWKVEEETKVEVQLEKLKMKVKVKLKMKSEPVKSRHYSVSLEAPRAASLGLSASRVGRRKWSESCLAEAILIERY